ncbi:MAG: MotA/TolQ/ExbB proton channel family protein [Panacagrimonas sp.]
MLEGIAGPYAAIREMIAEGGPVVVWIMIACVVMWTLVFERWWYFSRVLPRDASQMLSRWNARPERHTWLARQMRQAMISRLNVGMTSNLIVLRVLVPLCPLLGLLGTVSGMLNVFDSMAARGSADARAMATGVSEAMICTMTGLAVSITGLYPVYYFGARARRETELLSDRFSF